MRIIGGIARGKRIKAPSGLNTRPITDRIKESLFNIIGADIEGSWLLDLFAGSGSVGIEALSRRAAKVIFIDYSSDAVKTIKDNLNNCKFTEGYEVYRNDVFKSLEILQKREIKFDYIYIDPPFTNEPIFGRVMAALDKCDILKEEGKIIIRTQRKMDMPDRLESLKKFRLNEYGESSLHYYCLCKEELGE